VLGVAAHEACYRKKQAALAEKYAEQEKKLSAKSICRYCNAEVLASEERIVVLGAESHRSCYVKNTFVEEKEHTRVQDRQAADSVCSLCNKEVRASDLGSASFVGGRPR
jgi:hypothetical protein